MSSSSNNSVSSHLAVPSVRVPSNNQALQIGMDNRVSLSDIEHFANLDVTIDNNSANRLVHREINPPQQISHLDIHVHDQSRTGWGPGTYPTNYEVGRDDSWRFVQRLIPFLIDPSLHDLPNHGGCRSSAVEG